VSIVPEVALDETTHTYRVGGRVIPGVTRALEQIDELDGIPRDLLEAAARFGRHVHKAVHLFNQGTLDEEALDAPLVPYLTAYRKFLADTGARVIESERLVHHRKIGYAGMLDLTAIWGALPYPAVVDVKSSATIPRSVAPQTAGYREAYLSESPLHKLSSRRYCLQLKGNGEYRLKHYDDPKDWAIFLSCLNLHNWRAKNV
jgi:hypothetical protein